MVVAIKSQWNNLGLIRFLFFWRHQGFGVLSVILANHAIKLLTSLFQDLQVEALHRVTDAIVISKKNSIILQYRKSNLRSVKAFYFRCSVRLQGWASDGPPAELNIMAQSTSIQRVQRLIDSVPLTNLLFTLLSTSYKKVQPYFQKGNRFVSRYVILFALMIDAVLLFVKTMQFICQLFPKRIWISASCNIL